MGFNAKMVRLSGGIIVHLIIKIEDNKYAHDTIYYFQILKSRVLDRGREERN